MARLDFATWCEVTDKTKALANFGDNINKNAKIQCSNYDKVTLIKPKMVKDTKPRSGGIWYGCGPSWISYIYYNNWDYNFVHEIYLNESAMHFIKTKQDIKEFDEKYGSVERGFLNRETKAIDWSKVEKDFAGVDICSDAYTRDGWMYGWDTPSGVIWNQAGLRSSKLLAYWDGNNYVPV